MLTYDLSKTKGSLYKELYQLIKNDISSGQLKSNTKIPSKRTLAKNLGVSTITVENAYNQLISEGYIYSVEKSGYFISNLQNIPATEKSTKPMEIHTQKEESYKFDFSSNNTESANFPFSIWAKLTREIISNEQEKLLRISPCGGVPELKKAIANHLYSFRAMDVNPDQIIIGAGTEYLYGLLIKLLGNDKIYCIENPGYTKLKQIYETNNAVCNFANLDENGIMVEDLIRSKAQIAHISPNHHFPTGITMPVSRRYELLAWAKETENRYIIEDDYDSEFRQKGNPIPTMQSIDDYEKVIYMNTFSKSLTSTIRISYMILPEHLANLFYKKLSFYSCTVSTFEQYTLASFISEGYFEKHINRMRLHYGRKRTEILNQLEEVFTNEDCKIIEHDSGLHFILELNTLLTDQEIKDKLKDKGIKIRSISDYEMSSKKNLHQFILNYSNINTDDLKNALKIIKSILS